jgi:peptidyl-prolyl cis-trans isomerase D
MEQKMSEKARKSNNAIKETKKTIKYWTAVVLFSIIILVFVFLGINPARMGDTGGYAATVNDTAISLAEYNNRVEALQNNLRGRFDSFPQAQRKMFEQQIRRRALEELIMSEVMFQAARNRGISAPDGEVRDYILHIPGLEENGRFLGDRYKMWLQSTNRSPDEFERQIRKQLIGQKLQDLFIGSTFPSQEELKHNQELSHNVVNVRFVQLSPDDFQKPAFISSDDVAGYLKTNKAQVEKYYKDNIVEFTKQDKVQAKHILIRIDDKRKADEALKLITELKKEATPKTFAMLARKNSEDPGSKAKDGDLGEFERGRMVPEFDKAAFALKAGEISEPVKTQYGYHLIYVTKKTEGGQTSLEQAQNEIARKLIARTKEAELVAKTKAMVEKGDKKNVDSLINKAGLKWTDSGDFDLASATIPKLGAGKEVMAAILKRGQTPGLIPDLISLEGGRFAIVDVTSWKQTPDSGTDSEKNALMLAYRKSGDLMEAWSKEIEAKASVTRNPAVLRE